MKKWAGARSKRMEEPWPFTRCTASGCRIDGHEYRRVLTALIQKWAPPIEAIPKKKTKWRASLWKGFEPDLVWGILGNAFRSVVAKTNEGILRIKCVLCPVCSLKLSRLGSCFSRRSIYENIHLPSGRAARGHGLCMRKRRPR